MSPDHAPFGAPVFAAALVVALLGGCASGQAPKPVASVAVPGAKVVRLSEANAGANVTLDSAQTLIISLTLDVSTGVDWSIVDFKSGVLTLQSVRFDRLRSDAALGEEGGQVIWTLKAAAPGEQTLSFDLRRPRSLMPASRSVSYRVTVKPAAGG